MNYVHRHYTPPQRFLISPDTAGDIDGERAERDHIAAVLKLGGFPVYDFTRPGVVLWPVRARRGAA